MEGRSRRHLDHVESKRRSANPENARFDYLAAYTQTTPMFGRWMRCLDISSTACRQRPIFKPEAGAGQLASLG